MRRVPLIFRWKYHGSSRESNISIQSATWLESESISRRKTEETATDICQDMVTTMVHHHPCRYDIQEYSQQCSKGWQRRFKAGKSQPHSATGKTT